MIPQNGTKNQCFQCFPGSSAICCKSVENPQDFENAAFYQDTPENSDVSAPFGCENPKAVDATGLFGREGDFPPVP